MFVAQARQNRSYIIFGKAIIKPKLGSRSSAEESNVPQFNYYGLDYHKMIRMMGYDLTKGEGLCFN